MSANKYDNNNRDNEKQSSNLTIFKKKDCIKSMKTYSYRCKIFNWTKKDHYTSIKVPDKSQEILRIIWKWILGTDDAILLQERLQR